MKSLRSFSFSTITKLCVYWAADQFPFTVLDRFPVSFLFKKKKKPKWRVTLCLFLHSPRGMIKCSVLLQTSALLSVRLSGKVTSALSKKWESQSMTGHSVFCRVSVESFLLSSHSGVKSELFESQLCSKLVSTGLTQVLKSTRKMSLKIKLYTGCMWGLKKY